MYEYQPPSKRKRGVRFARPEVRREIHLKGNVVTLLEPALRELVTVATGEVFTSVHADSFEAARVALEDLNVAAVLVSPAALGQAQTSDLARLLARHPGVLPVAVIQRHGPGISERILALGRCGVSKVVDLDSSSGCNLLRATIEESGGVLTRRIACALEGELRVASDASRKLFSLLIRYAPTHPTVGEFAEILGTNANTLSSRFYRAGLPSPKQYVAHMRLLYAAAYLESPALSIGGVAHRLEYSSPQSFSRHVRTELGMTASAFRDRGFEAMREDYVARLIRNHTDALGRFDPFGAEQHRP